MAYLEDLIDKIPDPTLRKQAKAALRERMTTETFGLRFEKHLPEMTALPGVPVGVGSLVTWRDKPSSSWLRIVEAITEGTATLRPKPTEGSTTPTVPETVPVADLIVCKEFNEPIYPGLAVDGEPVERGGADKPWHMVINGENAHAAELLRYLYGRKVDCIYLDPPYNTGAKDWTYNNDYVDATDGFRHSKWLSFMEKRLALAKDLLKPDGVLIVTIDEHEVHTLGLMLREMFPDYATQMVTIVINQKGVSQGRLSRVEEYAFFTFPASFLMKPTADDLLSIEYGSESNTPDVRWERLLRGGTNSRRRDRPDLFFPIHIEPESKCVIEVGDPLPFDQEPDLSKTATRMVAWPLRTDGSFGNWRVSPPTLRVLLKQGYVKLGGFDAGRGTWTVLYLGELARQQIESGIIKIAARDEVTGAVEVEYAESQQRSLKTVWHRGTHDAGTYGSSLLRVILGEGGVFPFPKSLY